MTDLIDRISGLRADVLAIEIQMAERSRALAELEAQTLELASGADLLDKVDAVLQAVSSKVLGQSTATIDKLVTAGLKIVFHDQNLEFKTSVDKFRGKTSIKFELYEDGQTAPLNESYGGGVIVLIGVLLRVVTIIILNKRRFLFLDESLSHLSKQYHANASAFLKKLCSELNFTILMVSHQDGFVQNASRHYEAKRTAHGTVLSAVPIP